MSATWSRNALSCSTVQTFGRPDLVEPIDGGFASCDVAGDEVPANGVAQRGVQDRVDVADRPRLQPRVLLGRRRRGLRPAVERGDGVSGDAGL